MAAYYNEIEPFAAQWLRNLIAAGYIAPGDVDTRSIVDVQPEDLREYEQCHFFAGIGGWSYALRLAGWADNRPVWTGSCPCQPFSTAGKQRGSDDERHLWPAFFRLIRECRPGRVFGEQVAGASGLAWLDHVCADLEGAGYAAAAADLPACSVGAPHRRQRLFWVADAERTQEERQRQHGGEVLSEQEAKGFRRSGQLGCAKCDGSQGGAVEVISGSGRRREGGEVMRPSCSPWSDLEWLPCTDGKARPTQPGLSPLAYGVSGRVGRLRSYGNAIVPQVAAAFITACEQA